MQLLTDIERLGARGTIHHVAPGFMRNNLFPRGKARYLAQGGPLLLNPQDTSPVAQEEDEQLAKALRALPEITLERNARPRPNGAWTSESLLYRPVSMEMVADHLRESFEIKRLHPPYAVLSAKSDGGSRRRLMSTGWHNVEVRLRDGSAVPLRVRIQRKSYGQTSEEAKTSAGMSAAAGTSSSSMGATSPEKGL